MPPNPKNTVIKMFGGPAAPGNSILLNDNSNNSIPKYNNMAWGTQSSGVVGICDFHVFSIVNKQIQFLQMIIQTAKPQNITTNMVWGTRGPGALGICNVLCICNDKQIDPNISNYNPGHQILEYNN